MTVLVTGGLGLVGIHTARYFAQQGHDVVCYDRKPVSPLAAAILGDAQRVEVVTGDIEDHARLEEIMRSRGVQGVIHAAAVVNEKICREEPLVAARMNIGGSAAVLDVARRNGVQRFIYTSSATVYGPRRDRRPIAEDEARPGHVYGYSKYLAEQWTECYQKIYGLDCAIVRLSSVYGPGKSWAPDRYPKQRLCLEAINGNRYTMPDGGDYRRDFTFVTDVAAGIHLVYAAPKLDHRVFNIAAGEIFSLRDVAQVLNTLFSRAKLDVAPGQFEENVALQGSVRGPLSIDRARRELDFAPRTDLRRGLEQYTEFIARHCITNPSP
ncbi:MAG: NAD(P)-dependent oxidoreductase [Betaproteobacteria bacterium]|nr:NAD(P)-dependent oxidoreductase [Betaproteobacteria bacterium]